jgi:LacI family transcriptional regulator
MDYHPNSLARGLITRRTFTIGLVLPDISNPFFPAVARGVEDTAHTNGYNVILCNTDGNPMKEAEYLKVLRSKQVDGVIFTTSQVSTTHVKQLIDADCPVVLADRRMNVACDCVVVDNTAGAYQGTRHLLDLGLTSIGLVTGPANVTTGTERIDGYRMALRERGMRVQESLILEGDYKQHSGFQHAKTLMKMKKPPAAIFACNDLMAIGVLMALEEEGIRVPEDVAVVGYDDTLLASVVRPRLTTIAQPKYEIGAIACRLLIDRLDNPDKPPEHIVLQPHLVIRESSAIMESHILR